MKDILIGTLTALAITLLMGIAGGMDMQDAAGPTHSPAAINSR